MIVVADTSVILNLCRIQHEHLLQKLFQRVLIPKEVADEFIHLTKVQKRFSELLLPKWIEIQPTPKSFSIEVVETELDAGEAAAITLFLEQKADALLIDEKIGRKIAIQLGVRTIGILGILTDAKNDNLISSVKILLDRLENEAGFWVSRGLRLQVLKLVGE